MILELTGRRVAATRERPFWGFVSLVARMGGCREGGWGLVDIIEFDTPSCVVWIDRRYNKTCKSIAPVAALMTNVYIYIYMYIYIYYIQIHIISYTLERERERNIHIYVY